MRIPDNAAVKNFVDAELGNLLVGRFGNDNRNFFAVRAERQDSTGDPTPYMAILSAWIDNQTRPYLSNPNNTIRVLDLGHRWSVDVSIDESQPEFQGIPTTILVRSDACFFIHLKNREGYLDLTTGHQVDGFPNGNNVAYWSAFAIRLEQPDVDGPGEVVFCWPQNT